MFFLLFLPEGSEEKSLILHWYTNMRALVHELVKAVLSLPPVIDLLHFRHQPFPHHLLDLGIMRLWHAVVSYKMQQKNRLLDFGISLLDCKRCATLRHCV